MSESVGIALRFALYLDLMLLFGLGLFGLYGLKASERLSGAVLNFKGWLAGTALLGMLLSMASLLVMTRAMSGEQEWQALGPHLQMMLGQTEFGLTWMLRIGVLLVAALVALNGAMWPSASVWLATWAVEAGQYTLACRALRRSLSVEFGAVLLILGLVAWLGTLGPMASG